MRRATLPLLAIVQACATAAPHVTLPQGDVHQPHSTFRPGDDGPHPSAAEGYFEWWYYDATFDDGTSVSISLDAAQFSGSGRPAVLVNVLDLEGRTHAGYQAFETSALKLGGPGEITVADSSAHLVEGGAARVAASTRTEEGEAVSVDLTFTPTMPGFKAGTGEVRVDGKVAIGWAVPMPRARVEGVVRVGGVERKVRGTGYHDHNWGELRMADTIGYWYWGRIASEEVPIVYTMASFRENLGTPPLSLVVVGDAEQFRTVEMAPEIAALGEQWLPAANRSVPSGLRIHSSGIDLRLSSVKTLEAIDLSSKIPWVVRPLARLFTRPAYVRQLCDFQLDSRIEGVRSGTGRGIAEYMYVMHR